MKKENGSRMDPAIIRLPFLCEGVLVLEETDLFPSWFQLSGIYFYLPHILSNDYLNMRII